MHVEIFRIQLISILGSVALLGFIIQLLRKRKLKEEYSLLWLLGSLVFLALSIWRDLLTSLSFAVGVAYPPAALFLVLIMGAYMMLLHFSLLFSRLTEKSKSMAQEIALLKLELERLKANGSESEAVRP